MVRKGTRSVSDENYDVTYTFNLADADGNNQTDTENLTAIKVNMADIVVKKHSVGNIIIFYQTCLFDLVFCGIKF